MNKFANGLAATANTGFTENGARTYKSTMNGLMDLFAFGGAYRKRSDEDCILLFKKAFNEDAALALKCLFYLRDVRGGQGERRFFRVICKYLAIYEREVMRRNLIHIPLYGRWDDLYTFVDTPLEQDAFKVMYHQLALDVQCKTPSLLAKWLKSENTSSQESKALARRTAAAFGMTPRQYRKTLSVLRERINVLERLMSAGRWEDIEFDKIPSKAGMIYKNTFAKHDIERAKAGARTYEDFAKDTTTKVNAKALYPYECVEAALKAMGKNNWGWGYRDSSTPIDDTQRLMVNKYWDNLADYIQNKPFNGMAVVDTSGSMAGTPMNVAISLGMYCAEKAQGPFHNHFITFSDKPAFITVEGVDFCDKVVRMSDAPWGSNTNIERAFDLMLNTAINNHCTQDEIPQTLLVISDMEFNYCVTSNSYGEFNDSLFEKIRAKWQAKGYKMPHLVFWNVNARNNNIPMRDDGNVTYISGFSPVLFEQLLSNKSGIDLILDKLNSERYEVIR